MIDVRDIQGNIVKSVPITQACQKIEELMVSDYIQLSWNSDSNEELQAGCYIEYNGEKFSLLEPYKPTQKNEVEFTYTPQFKSKVMAWSKVPFFFYTTNEDKTTKEPDWTLTSNPADFMKCVCDALKNETGEDWTYTIDASLPASASLSFNTVDIFSSLNEIARIFETEWYADKVNNILYLGKASFGESVTLEVGENIKVPSVNNTREGYYTRFYAFGSTRNITQDYEGSNVNNLVNKRLTLDPVKYPNGYKDIRVDLRDGEIFSKVLVFEDVYPSSKLSISSVRNRLMYRVDGSGNKIQIGTDENGNPIYDQYAIWYFRINGFEFDTKNIIQGQTLSVHFQTGALAGREFELKYYESKQTITTSDGLKFDVQKGDYEILFVEEGNYIIPSLVGLVPSEGDEVVLFNIEMPSEYTQSAYDELEAELDKEIERLTSNLNNYSFNSNPVAFSENNPNLTIGRNVTYKNGDETLNTRVIKLTTQLDFPIEQNITIGNEKIKGNTQQLKEEVATANKDLNLLAVFNDMTSSLQQSYNRTQQMMLDGFAAIKNIWQLKEDDNGNKYIYSAFNVATEGGVSMYRNLGFSNIPSIYDGLPIDHNTIYWENGILKAKGGGGGVESITKQMVIEALGFTPYSAENPNGYITAASIPSALKNPYALTFGSKTYDGSSAKSITASDLGAALSSDLSKYLPLSGGILTDILTIKSGGGYGLKIQSTNNDVPSIVFSGTSGSLGRIFINGLNGSFYRANNDFSAMYKIWDEGNDGSGSGLDADTLDGVHASKLYQVNSAVDLGGTAANYDTLIVRYSNTSATSNHPYSIVGGNQCVALNLYAGTDYAAQLAVGFGFNYLAYRRKINSTSWQSWVKINAGLADEATKLQTARTIWGQSFDGTGNVSGDLNGVGRIIRTEPSAVDMDWAGNFIFKNLESVAENYWHIETADGTPILVVRNNGNIGIGTTSPIYKLHVKASTNTPIWVEQNYSSAWTAAMSAFNGSLVAGQHYNINIGYSNTANNQAWVGYYHAGVGSNNNRLSMGLHSVDDVFNITALGNVGIGTTSPSAKLHVVGNILATGGLTMQSQRSLKNVVDERGLSLTDLSAIKPTRYTWKDKRDDRIHFGGIADDIEKVLPEVIYRTSEGTLTMDYGNAGFAIASSLIKPVVDHEERIKVLERENKELKEQIKQIKCA